MSITHNIIYKKPLSTREIGEYISYIDGTNSEVRGEEVLNVWVEGKSTRGIDIAFGQGKLEIRNTILSNKCDYELTNKIVAKILSITEGVIFDENEEQVSNFPLFDNDRISNMELYDCKTILAFSKEHEDIVIYGPIRMVHFGKRLYEQFKDLKDEELKNKIFETILNVNYRLPNFEYGSTMQIGDANGDKKNLKLLINKTDCIIGKYDYILINTGGEEEPLIMITNEILNTMLPSNWTLVDEFTIVAPIADENEWNLIVSKAQKYDMTDDFFSNKYRSH